MAKDKSTEAPVLEAWDDEDVKEAGFRGRVVDPTPNSHYTVAGGDLPTPETDPEWAKQAQARIEELAS
jgi:hypothetical protein